MVGEISHRSNPHAGNAEETEMAATGIIPTTSSWHPISSTDCDIFSSSTTSSSSSFLHHKFMMVVRNASSPTPAAPPDFNDGDDGGSRNSEAPQTSVTCIGS